MVTGPPAHVQDSRYVPGEKEVTGQEKLSEAVVPASGAFCTLIVWPTVKTPPA
jgi:hypothetical protein